MNEHKWNRLRAHRFSRRRILSLSARAGVGAAGLALVGCGDDDDDTDDGTASEAPATQELQAVSFALDWVPNTNHTGFHVASERGYYAEEGIEISILPYSNVSPDTLVGAGQANFGISFGTSIPFSVLAGLPIASVLPILQRPASALVYLGDGPISSPSDLDGATYAGFGAPFEAPIISRIIQEDGGAGDFDAVTLSTFAYEAVLSGESDFAWAFVTWEGVDFDMRGEDVRELHFRDFGFPDWYAVVLMGNTEWMAENPDLARGFVRATKHGFEDVIADPAGTADVLVDANADTLADARALARASSELLATQYMLDADGNFGTQTLQLWTDFPKFLFEIDALADGDGNPLTAEPDYAKFFTNAYL
jgi:ABC-type nitrate/sulfonate/bicarbonate transport system substrate-binding protein